MRRFLLVVTLIGMTTGAVVAEVPDTTWQALLNRQVVVTYTDGTQATGTLALVKSATISLILADGGVVTVAKTKVEGVRAVVAPAQRTSTAASSNVQNSAVTVNTSPPKKTTNTRASSSASMEMGMRDADLQYHSGWFWGGFLLGLLGVGLSYTAEPTPAVAPDPTKVDVSSYIAGYQQEAKKKAHRSAWGGFATEALITFTVVLIVSANSSAPSSSY